MRTSRRDALPVSIAFVLGACASDPGGETVGTAGRKRVFFDRNGALGQIRDATDLRPSLVAADDRCQRDAQQHGLDGTWRAWLSSSEADAIDRIDDVSPWYRLDQQTLLFETKAELAQGPRVRVDASDEAEDWDACVRLGACGLAFWTGTTSEGLRTSSTCVDWTVYNRPAVGTVGRADQAGAAWIGDEPLQCGAYLALLCLEQ